MMRSLGKLVAIALMVLAFAATAQGEEQTRESYKAQVEPICQAIRVVNEKIMAGAAKRVNKNQLEPAGKQFVRVSESFGKLVKQIVDVPPPVTDVHRIERWIESMKLLKTRLRLVGKYFIEGLKIKGNHESVLAQRAGISANNTTVPLHLYYCRFGRFDSNG